MRPLILAVLLSGCVTTIRELKVPPGEARTFVMDQNTLWEACRRPSRTDDGHFLNAHGTVSINGKKYEPGDDIHGCYDASIDTIFLEESCRGAQAWVHERAHRAGVKDPKKEGYNWGSP